MSYGCTQRDVAEHLSEWWDFIDSWFSREASEGAWKDRSCICYSTGQFLSFLEYAELIEPPLIGQGLYDDGYTYGTMFCDPLM